jgi:hypothetical protein
MASTPISPRLVKGAFIEFSNRFGVSFIPNIIIFQYNPERIIRKLEGWKEDTATAGKSKSDGGNAQPFDPGETLEMKLEFDATDVLDKPATHPLAVISGIADRISAVEMLLYPQQETSILGLLGSLATSLGGAALSSVGAGVAGGLVGGLAGSLLGQAKLSSVTEKPVPRGTLPTVLFAWSPSRLVPVRLTNFSVEETGYTTNLYPLRATVSITMRIIAPNNIPCSKTEADKKAVSAYNTYQRQKRDFAAANIAANVEYAITDIYSTLTAQF